MKKVFPERLAILLKMRRQSSEADAFLPTGENLSYAHFDALRITTQFEKVAETAGLADLWKRTQTLPEFWKAYDAWKAAASSSMRVPDELTLGLILQAVRGDPLVVKDGLDLSESALKALVTHWPSPKIAGAAIAIAAMQSNFSLVRGLLDQLKRKQKSERKLRDAQFRWWLPLLLWLMDDVNGCAALNHFLDEKFSVQAYKKARTRQNLLMYPKAFLVVDLGTNGTLSPRESPWLRRGLALAGA